MGSSHFIPFDFRSSTAKGDHSFIHFSVPCLTLLPSRQDAVAVHGACGVWGVLAVGVFMDRDRTKLAYAVDQVDDYGFVMGGGGRQFAAQVDTTITKPYVPTTTSSNNVLVW